MAYLYETHCHSAKTSACSTLKPDEIVDFYLKNGYDGVFITDHFLNGNTTVHRDHPNASYEEQIEYFFEGYEGVKRAAEGTHLQVFFGLEYSYKGTDVLAYGWNKQELKRIPEIMKMTMRQFCEFCKDEGVLAVQAHPFREDFYIDHIRLFPTVEGVEIFNACRNDRCNRLAKFYAEEYSKVVTSGTDIHFVNVKRLGGMEFEEKIIDEKDFAKKVSAGLGKCVERKNVLYKN